MATQIEAKLGRRRNSERIRWRRRICREGKVLAQEVLIRINLSPLQCTAKPSCIALETYSLTTAYIGPSRDCHIFIESRGVSPPVCKTPSPYA
jgi:hypothetical protein